MNGKQAKKLRRRAKELSDKPDTTYNDQMFRKFYFDYTATPDKHGVFPKVSYEVFTRRVAVGCQRYFYKMMKKMFVHLPAELRSM